jgi:flagellar hook assembly protein FlgD
VNDLANFGGTASGAKIEIYDVTGRRVRTVVDQNVWDGRDDGGEVVESGVYVYQAEIEGQKISGVITVAK